MGSSHIHSIPWYLHGMTQKLTKRRTWGLLSETATLVGIVLLALAAVDLVAYGRFVRSLLFR
ncbi:hypothetical protein BH09MYX1_BH09MYX1_25430 [soil metagenome]